LERLLTNFYGQNGLRCPDCAESITYSTFETHRESCLVRNPPFPCPNFGVCRARFASARECEEHIWTHHTNAHEVMRRLHIGGQVANPSRSIAFELPGDAFNEAVFRTSFNEEVQHNEWFSLQGRRIFTHAPAPHSQYDPIRDIRLDDVLDGGMSPFLSVQGLIRWRPELMQCLSTCYLHSVVSISEFYGIENGYNFLLRYDSASVFVKMFLAASGMLQDGGAIMRLYIVACTMQSRCDLRVRVELAYEQGPSEIRPQRLPYITRQVHEVAAPPLEELCASHQSHGITPILTMNEDELDGNEPLPKDAHGLKLFDTVRVSVYSNT